MSGSSCPWSRPSSSDGDAAAARRSKAVRWLDRALADRSDPAVLGAMNDASERMQLRMQLEMVSVSGLRFDPNASKRFQPTWRQLIELELTPGRVRGRQRPPQASVTETGT